MQRQNGKGVLAAFSPETGKPGVSRRGEGGAFLGVRLVDRLIERVLVDVAVQRVGADVAVVDVAGECQAAARAVTRL